MDDFDKKSKEEQIAEIAARLESLIPIVINILATNLKLIERSQLSKISGMAFDILERILNNLNAVIYIVKPLGRYDATTLTPISQVFRAIVYDLAVAHWLFGNPDLFNERLRALNSDFVRLNNNKISTDTSDQDRQEQWRNWYYIAPDAFFEDENRMLKLNLVKPTKFNEICQVIAQEYTNGCGYNFINTLPESYSLLSQQAHVSSFSSEVFLRYNLLAHLRVFDNTCLFLLPTCILVIHRLGNSKDAYERMKRLFMQVHPEYAKKFNSIEH